ncbi:MAG: Tetratricopeptide repeat protein [Syntrophorhabdus sp. PtaU1.Bin153]|nr:MAG: Tetratricopeptide repeat protein [Syntrophorhabdus sp. PtaU1.Bin153]
MTKKTLFMILLGAMCVAIASVGACRRWDHQRDGFSVTERPTEKRHVYDYAGILKEGREYAESHLKQIQQAYAIEAVVVSIPSLGDGHTIEQTTSDIMNNWRIGGDHGGRGIVLLLAEKERGVKMEVSYELEGIFTDLFCGYIEDLQLQPYFTSGQVGIGLIAVMEELEKRAQIEAGKGDKKALIARLDQEYLSGGAGAKKELSVHDHKRVRKAGSRFPAGRTPAEAWETMIQAWREKVRDPDLGVYTSLGRLIYRDYQSIPDTRFEENLKSWGAKPYRVLQQGRYAVIFFGNQPGWDNAPFLFFRSKDGWQFDVVHQRKFIRMGPSPVWGVEWSNHPYVEILSSSPGWMGQDRPFADDDACTNEREEETAARILELEEVVRKVPREFGTTMELGRLYAICSMGLKAIPLLEKAKELDRTSSLPYKYLAIAHVDAFYQYRAALRQMEGYVQRAPDDPSGYSFLGYLHLQLHAYNEAIKALKRAISLNPDNCYAYAKLSEVYAGLYKVPASGDKNLSAYKTLSLENLKKAESAATRDPRRVMRLKKELQRKGVLNTFVN